METETTIPADGFKRLEDMPDDLSILFIEGYCIASWMQEHFRSRGKINGIGPFDSCRCYRVWVTEPEFLGDDPPPDAFGVDRCIEEISTGKYHAIVVVDLSNNIEDFGKKFSGHLQAFVENGGVVAFPSSESSLVHMLQDTFGVTWQRSGYYRTTWSPCQENEHLVKYSFGNGDFSTHVIKDYNVKGNTLLGVPPHERCFGVSSESRTNSLVPFMDGRDVSREEGSDDYDVIVAMHEHGKGVIAYFGDVNGEDETIQLVAAFVQSRAPKLPVDCFAGLTEEEFNAIKELKEQGNAAFQTGKLNEALELYQQALKTFGARLGSNGPQRDVYINLHSNMSLIYFKQEKWFEAETAATRGVEQDCFHEKCLFRRAKARLKFSRATKGGDIARLTGAKADLVACCKPGDATFETTQKLLLSTEQEIKRLKKQQQKSFLKGFGQAL